MPPISTPRPKLVLAALIATAVAALSGAPAIAADLVRTFHFSPQDVTLQPGVDGVRVQLRGGVPDGVPGGPEVPVVPAYVDLPAGMTVRSVSIVGEDWVPVGVPQGRIRPAARVSPGLPVEMSAPDPALYAADAWLPVAAGRRGPAGEMRGRAIAGLALSPVRVRPGSGEVEVATTIRVSLELAPDLSADALVRRRVVPAWEEQFRAAVAHGALGLESYEPAWPASARLSSPTNLQPASGGGGFQPTVVPSVEGSPVQYLILTTNAMASEMQRLADWRTRTGIPTVVRTIEFIQANYPYGVDLQDRIRRFIREAYTQWGVTFVLIGGDTEVIPVRYGQTTFFGGNSIPTDLYYADLNGNWNADGDSLFGEAFLDSVTAPGDNADLYPEVWVGRAPVTNATQAKTFVDKVLQYSRTPLGDYEDRAVFAGEVLFPQDWSQGQSISLDGAQDCESAIARLTPDMKPRRMYENYLPFDTLGAVRLTRQALLDTLGRGWGIFHHVGHGYRNSMSVGDAAITNPDAEALANGNRTWLLYSINCTSNAIDFACLGEAFVLNPNGGAVANIGSTREDFPVTGRSYQDEFYDLMFTHKVKTLGEAFWDSKLPFIGLAYYDNTHRWTQYTLTLLGDPAMPLYTRKPFALSVTAPATVPLSDTTFTVHVEGNGGPLQGALVCLNKTGQEYEVDSTDASGNVVLNVRPETAGSAFLTVTAHNAHPYEGTVTFGAATGPVLVSRAANRSIDDDNTGGTQGSGDGLADSGERIDWTLPVSNTGSVSAPSVTATLSSSDPRVTILGSTSTYGTINPGVVSVGQPYRVQVAEDTPDGAEILFHLDLFSGPNHWVDEFRLPVKAPSLVQVANVVVDNGANGTTGNSNGRLEAGETVDLSIVLRNTTTGTARAVTATLASSTPGITVVNGNATFGDVPANTQATSTPFRVVNASAGNPTFTLTVSDAYGVRYVKTIDVIQPVGVVGLVGTGAASSISLVWKKSASGDLQGYNIYRSASSGGPFSKVNVVPTDRTALYVDENLPALTRFYYQIAAVDSSGNESTRSSTSSASTNPPLHVGFPLPTERNMPSPPAIGNIDNSNDSSYEIVAGANVLYAWHADGTPLRDADGTERTAGDFTTEGSYYAGGATIADLDGDGTWEIVAPSWDTKSIHVFRVDGTDFPGFPKNVGSSIWSSAAVGNIDGDPQLEIVFGSRDNKLFAFNYDGTEVRDGDSNAGTIGVFKVLGASFNDGSPALADLDGDGKLDIIYASFDGNLYAWRYDGSNLPGFPIALGASTTCSPAVGDIDNDGQLEIVVTANNGSLRCYKQNGSTQPGFPVFSVASGGVSKAPSPALADMDGNGTKDIVINTTDGYVKVFRPDGTQLPQWTTVRYSYTSKASESSPVVADIDGDGQNEVIVGGEDANLYAFDNDGSLMAGFPIHLNGEVRGTPTVWDLDHDGLTEILLSCWDKNVYLWEYPGAFCPTATPAWAMWRHDNQRMGRLGAPIVLAANTATFAADDASEAGLALSFVLPSVAEAGGSYDVYRGPGEGETGAIAQVMPAGFVRLNSEPLQAAPGDLVRYLDAAALPGVSYRYLLVHRAATPGEAFLAYGPFAASASGQAPTVAFVSQNFPNPVRGGGHTSFAYGVPGEGAEAVRTTLRLYDVRGRAVRTLVDGIVPPGRYQATWDGTDDRGAQVGSGVYFYEYVAGPTRVLKKALVIGR